MGCKHRNIHAWAVGNRQLIVVLLSGSLITAAWAIRAAGVQAPFTLLMSLAAVIAGIPVVRLAWTGLRAGRFTIPALIVIATAGALWIRETWEAAAVTFFYVLGNYLEDLTMAKTGAPLRSLLNLAPRTARLKRDEEFDVVPADAVQPGETVVVLPGDRVPVDGVVSAGRALLDTATLTGEPLPVEVGQGDKILGGSVCREGYLEVVAEQVGASTTFRRLLFLVAEVQHQKPTVQRFLDRFAQWYTPAVIIAAMGLYLFTGDVEAPLTFLVIGCPGALVVAAPVAVVAGRTAAARQGILIRGGERLERIRKADVILFDKTVVLTRGQPRVSTVTPFTGFDADRVLALAAAAEQRSEHHLATAILTHASETGVRLKIPGPNSRAGSSPASGTK